MDSLGYPFDVSVNETYDAEEPLTYVSLADVAGMLCVADPERMAKPLSSNTKNLPPPGRNVRIFRVARDWSLATLGDRCNPPIPAASVQRVEAGTAGYTSDMLHKLADALGVTVPDLFLPEEIALLALLSPDRKARAIATIKDMIEIDRTLQPNSFKLGERLAIAEPKPRRTRRPNYNS